MSLFVAVWLPVAVVGLLYPLQRNGFRSSGRQLQELVLPFAKGKRPCVAGRICPPPPCGGVALALGGVSTTPPHAHRWWVHPRPPPIARAHPRPL